MDLDSFERFVRLTAARTGQELNLTALAEDVGISQSELARRIQVPFQRVNDVVHGRRAVTPSTALRLSRFFGNSPSFWMNAQLTCDLYEAERAERRALAKIQPAQTG